MKEAGDRNDATVSEFSLSSSSPIRFIVCRAAFELQRTARSDIQMQISLFVKRAVNGFRSSFQSCHTRAQQRSEPQLALAFPLLEEDEQSGITQVPHLQRDKGSPSGTTGGISLPPEPSLTLGRTSANPFLPSRV